MNPIYKFELTADGTTQQAFPNWKDDLTLDFEKESQQEFFRAKLSGKLTFQSEDYTYIVSQAFDTQFLLEIFISYNAGQTWTSYWRGTFWKTDCEFDDGAQTVVVQPTVSDNYNDIIAGLDKAYNLIELAPDIVPLLADKRPMVQVYVPGQSVIGCFLSGMWWEQECEPESDTTKLVNTFKFSLNKTIRIVEVTQEYGWPEVPDLFTGEPYGTGTTTAEYTNGNFKFRYVYASSGSGSAIEWSIIRISDNVKLWSYSQSNVTPPTIPNTVILNPVSGSGAVGNVTLYIHDIAVYSRFVCDTETVEGVQTYEIPADDIVENNRNYHRIIGYYFPSTIYFSSRLSETPTQWGIYQPGQYYDTPYILGNPEFFPVARNAWGRVSIWYTFSMFDHIVEQSGRKQFTIKDAYSLASVISVLLNKIAPGITHADTTDYSQFLYGQNLIGIAQTLLITPKSNIISSGYDQPAQKAPITLKNVLDMLRDCFRCYWFVDAQNRFRIEHIQYFRNGGSYTNSPVVGIDLTEQLVSRNGKQWSFGRNQYQFDKPEMAARYQFGWMDDVTQLFEGYPIDIVSKYVNPNNIEQIDIPNFTSDIDYILLNPGEISKDGFVLMSALYSGGTPGETFDLDSYTLRNYWINSSTNVYGTNASYKHILIPVTGGQQIKVISTNDRTAQIAWLTSDATPVAGGTPPFVDGTVVIIQPAQTIATYTVPEGARFMYVYFGGSPYALKPISISRLAVGGNYYLPYYNYVVGTNDHYLQNAYVAFCFLQEYYKFDMPARNYTINGVAKIASGIKRLKTQTLRFPVLADPNLTELVKTNLGNGTIDKLSVNLSSRNANATLKYDTEQ